MELQDGPPTSEPDGNEATWKTPRINVWRLAAIFFAFINFGMNDAAYGPLLPYQDYRLSYTVASLIFLTPFVGYTVAALLADRIHLWAGRRGIALLSPLARLIAYIVVATHPPFPAVAVIYVVAGFGNGLLDGAWNAWAGTLGHANEILGLLHGCYGAGAVISPAIATAMITKYGLSWWQFYYLMVALMVAEAICVTTAFWRDNAQNYRQTSRSLTAIQGATRQALKSRITWIASAFLFVYVGVEVTIGGFIVLFMQQIRRGSPSASGFTATGFWLGLTLGRITLGFLTAYIGLRASVFGYVALAIAGELVFWLVPHFMASAVTISLVGFFIGPLFPSAVVLTAKLLPKELHVASLGFSSAMGGVGAAILPFIVGAIVEAKGVEVLRPIVLAFLLAILVIWGVFR